MEGVTVLIVDDNEAIVKLLKRKLKKAGYNVLSAENGQNAISVLKKQKVDLTLLDEMMPEMTGTETLNVINAQLPNAPPTIMMTAHGSIGLAVNFMKNGGYEFITKPIDFEVLHLKINRALKDWQTQNQLNEAKMAKTVAEKVAGFKDDLLNFSHHEFRTPLGIIHSKIQTVLKNTNLDTRMIKHLEDSLEIVNQQVSYHQKLTEAAIVNCTVLKLKTLFLADMYRNIVVTKLNMDPLRKTAVVEDINPRYSVWADENALRFVLVNLLENALKFTDEGEVRIAASEVSGNIIVKISDTGIGIDPKKHGSIFTKLGKADLNSGKYPGLGIGLYTSRILIEKMNGKIWVEGEPGVGSDFYFSLPKGKE